jgi:hypothetical protein
MTNAKDSAEAVKFLSLLARLKDCCDDDPENLSDLARDDNGVKGLCIELSETASFLRVNERRRRELFATPVDPKFLTAWRDFEERFDKPVGHIWFSDFIDIFPEPGDMQPRHMPKADLQWEIADDDGSHQAYGIENAITYAYEKARDNEHLDEDFRKSVEDGMAAWQRLKHDAGFDLKGVFRRRELVPFVLVPRHVAAKHGRAQALSMLKNLQQAHDAFVFGAPFAALALMRSILEAVLRDHYGAEGKDLSERINKASKQLPSGASVAALHRLRERANVVLHLNLEKHDRLPEADPTRLEKEIVSLLFVLRALIEGAPQWRA